MLVKKKRYVLGLAGSVALVVLLATAQESGAATATSLFKQTATPRHPAATWDTAKVELGVKFKSSTDGTVSAIRFYKGDTNTGTHTGTLWNVDGTQLATVTFANETASGWQTATLPTPVSIKSSTTYVVSYLAPNGNYAYSRGTFNKAVTRGHLTVPKNGGVFLYGGGFPKYSYNGSNYYVDVIFNPSTPTPTTPKPTTSSSSTVPSTNTTPKPTTPPTKPTSTTTSSTTAKPADPTTTSTTAPPMNASGPGIAAPAGKTWTLAFSEEFNGTDYDHTKLTPCFDWNTGDCTSTFNNGRETYRPEQVKVSGGQAHLTAEPLNPPYKSSACQNGSCTYKSGLLSTARANASNSNYLYTFTYGYVESNMKIPHKQGFFTAFWMLPADKSYNYNTEIDILENLGYDTKTMYQTYHYAGRDQSFTPNTGTGNNGACPVIDYSTDFHKIGVDWQKDHVAFYIDGKMCGQYTNAANIENGPMQIIMDMMVDNNWQRQWNEGLADPTATATWDIDYLRVYQAK